MDNCGGVTVLENPSTGPGEEVHIGECRAYAKEGREKRRGHATREEKKCVYILQKNAEGILVITA